MGVERGAQALRRWRHREGLSFAKLGEMVGDRGGFQLCRFENGQIEKLPLRIALRVCQVTGLSPRTICSPEDRELIAAAQELGSDRGREYTRA